MRCGSARRGQALVESALTFPLLLALVLGVLQVALYFHARDVFVAAVQDGARLAAEEGRAPAEGVARARLLIAAGLGGAVTEPRVDATADDSEVALRASAQLRPIVPLPMDAGLPIDVTARVAHEHFRPDGGGS
jgi:Flp pilus assembly protein TadG